MRISFGLIALLVFIAAPIPVVASDTNVVSVDVTQAGGQFNFSVTLRHNDSGWEHYANVWEIISPDGTVLGTRVLAHPHVNEQPFTRSLNRVDIASGVTQVIVRAGDNIGGIGGKTMKVLLPGRN